MATRTQKLKVGVFLIFCAAFMTAGVLVISGYTTEPTAPYWMRFDESILGLGAGGLVEYLGVPVGKVEDIYVDADGSARVLISVSREKVTLHQGVKARLVLYSLAAGTMAIELDGGDAQGPELPENSDIPVERSLIRNFTQVAEDVFGNLDKVMKDIGEISESLKRAMTGMEEGAITKMTEDMNALVNDGRTFVGKAQTTLDDLDQGVQRAINEYTKLGKDMQYLVDDVGDTTDGAKQLIDVTKEKIAAVDVVKLQDDLHRVMENVVQISERLNTTIDVLNTSAGSVTHDVDNLEYAVRESLVSATEALDSISLLATSLQEDPAALIRGRGKPKGTPEP